MGPDSWAGRMWICGVFVSGPGELAPECWLTTRDLGVEAMDDRLLHHCIHTGADVGGLLLGSHALAGVIPGRSRRPHCRAVAAAHPLSARGPQARQPHPWPHPQLPGTLANGRRRRVGNSTGVSRPGPFPSARSSIDALGRATQGLLGDYRDLVRVSIATAERSLWLVIRKSVMAASILSNQVFAVWTVEFALGL